MLKIVFILLFLTLLTLAIILYLLYIPPLKIEAQSTQKEKFLTLEHWFKNLYQHSKFNGSVLLAKKGDILFSKSYGYDSHQKLTSLTQHASFNLASVSKQFTAMGILLLHKEGKLNYSDKLYHHIPELKVYKNITIEHLLHHTSGLCDYMKLSTQKSEVFTTKRMIALYQTQKPKLHFASGSKFEYSNTGYVLLSEVIARVSGISFESFMKKYIFTPLKMNDTQIFNLLSKKKPSHRVYGYQHRFWLFGGKKLLHDLNFFDGVAGDGGVYASAYDLYLWDEALKNGSLLSKRLYDIAYKPALLSSGERTDYGFGWFLNADGSVEHTGGWQGFSTFIYRELEEEILIVILDNSANALRVNAIGCRFNSIGINLKNFMKAY